MNDHIYQWFVVRGRVALWIEDGTCILQVDPEEHIHCILTAQDVHDIAGLLGMLAQRLWEQGGAHAAPEVSRYRDDGGQRYSWALDDQEARLEVWLDTQFVCMRAPDTSARPISLTMAVELVQILDHLEALCMA